MLLQVPVEVRHQVYDVILCLSTQDHLSLLSTCRQIHSEAHAYLYRRHIVLNSQKALYKFIRCSRESMLKQVTTLTLRLEDANPEEHIPILSELANERLSFGSSSHPLFQECQRITRHLSKMPSITSLSILPPRERIRYPPPDLVEGVLGFACKQWPNLSSLAFLLDNVSLNFLRHFTNLKTLHLTGFSLSSPHEAAQVLSGLLHLSRLSLTAPYVRQQQESKVFRGRRIVQSFVSSTMRHVGSLRSLAMSERLDISRDVPAFMNHEMFVATRDLLAAKLTHIKIAAAMALDPDVVSDIGEILKAAQSLKVAEMGWHNLEPNDVLAKLPESICNISIALPSGRCSSSTVEELRPSLEGLPNLRQLNLCIIDRDAASGLSSYVHDTSWGHLLEKPKTW
ncbi:MAG: hypothetical protein Q9160_001667 [Pyrenula sp. 1 TL-2023]